MSLVYVGATNVGSIKLHFDPELKTNKNLSIKDINKLKTFDYSDSK